MRASLLTKVGSLAAAAAIATTGAMAASGAAGAATAVTRLPTHLTAVAIPVPPTHRHTVILGHLSSHHVSLRGLVVFLDRKSGHVLIQVAHQATNRLGAVAFVVSPNKPTQYILIFKGTRNFAPSVSNFVTARP